MMDQMGEVDYAPGEPKGTPWHPHRGFETVTYIIDGVFDHQDSHGGGGSITNGDTQWMTAGAGILHIETPPEWLVQSGGLFHGIQLWVNLPRDEKLTAPPTRTSAPARWRCWRRPTPARSCGSSPVEVDGHAGPGSTHTPMALVHASVEPGARLDLPWNPDFNALVYVLGGSGTVGNDGQPIKTGQAAVFGSGDYLTITADARQESRMPQLDVIVVGGRPIREPLRLGRPVRDEHQGRGAGGVRGLPEGPLRPHPVDVRTRHRSLRSQARPPKLAAELSVGEEGTQSELGRLYLGQSLAGDQHHRPVTGAECRKPQRESCAQGTSTVSTGRMPVSVRMHADVVRALDELVDRVDARNRSPR